MHRSVLVFRLCLTILAFLPLTTLQASSNIGKDIIKSPNDSRDYGYLTLSNGLDVLLISDPDTDKAAAALDVSVGSSDDPEAYQGLAHFLEHMLFLGTKEYPDPDEYQKFISDHGGNHNAFTSLEHTNYFFDINANFLEGALDRFSQQFAAPLFNADYVSREVNAVHSEFSSKIKDDGRRFYSALKQTLSPNHPYRNFSVGNLSTLKADDETRLRDALLDFYDTHYSANRMKLVVLGKEPLSELAVWVKSRFTNISNKEIDDEVIEEPLFSESFLPAKISVQSIMDTRTMTLAFPLPSANAHRSSQPISYIANLIGHEGSGSLLSALKDEQLVDSLGAGAQFDTKKEAVFTITMSLTPKGFDQQKQIIDYVFAYIDLIRKEGVQERYFDEQKRMLELEFTYQEKSQPYHYVSSLANTLQDTPVKNVLFERYNLSSYEPALYREYLSFLRPDNMLVAVKAQSVEGDVKTKWYDTPYKIESLDSATKSSPDDKLADLRLPEKNIFIPDELSLINAPNSAKPEKIYSRKGLEVWYAANTEFGSPKANLFLTLRSPMAMQSPENQNQTELMISLFKDALNEFAYPAYLAGLNYEIYDHVRGLTIKISGYSEKQSVLLNKLLMTIKHRSFKPERLRLAKDRLKRSLVNAKDRKPYEQILTKAQQTLLTPSWTEEERLSALDNIDIDAIESFRQDFFGEVQVLALNMGNVTRAATLNTSRQIESILLSGVKTTDVNRPRVVSLGGDTKWFDTLIVKHPDTGFLYYIQGANRSHDEQSKFLMLSQVLASDYYAELRTKQQLGYIVFATNFNLLEVPGIAFVVQSPTASGKELTNATEALLKEQTIALSSMEQSEFNRYKEAVISRLEEKENRLYQVSNRYWQELDRQNYEFNTRQRLIDEIRSLSIQSLEAFVRETTGKKGNVLAIYSVTQEDSNEEKADSDLEGFSAISNAKETSLKTFPEY